jgi:hypothetical protein
MNTDHGWMWTANSNVNQDEWKSWNVMTRENVLTRELEAGRSWFRSVNFNPYPNQSQILAGGPEIVLQGWTPVEPIIFPETRVLAMGSCFAANFAEWLAVNGYNQSFAEPTRTLLRNPFENVSVISQQFRWAFGEVDPENLLWIGKDKTRVFATEERRQMMRQSLSEANVIIITLSLSEIWYDKITGEPLWRIATTDCHDPTRHDFKVLSFAETIAALNDIERIRATWLPNLKIVYTVSPMPLGFTFRAVSAVTASTASKAIVRAALDEFIRSLQAEVRQYYFYYPAFEVTELLANPFLPDNRHLFSNVIDVVLGLFAQHYTGPRNDKMHPLGGSKAWAEIVEGHSAGSELQVRNMELQRVCDERLETIERLDVICQERLQLIERLNETCQERLQLIERLNETRATVR